MIQRLASKTPDRLPMRGTAGEHECCACRGVLPKHRKHPALVAVAEVKETVPRKDAGKLPLQRKLAHVGNDPFLLRETLSARGDHARRRIHASYGMAKTDQICSHRFGGAAA